MYMGREYIKIMLRQDPVIGPYDEGNTTLETLDVIGQVAQDRNISGFTRPRRDRTRPGKNVYDSGALLKSRSGPGKCNVVPI
jgi:hypothetical protein